MSPRLVLTPAIVLLALLPVHARAELHTPVEPGVMRAQSAYVVDGNVVRLEPEMVAAGGRIRLATRVTLEVVTAHKGSPPKILTFYLHGGRLGDRVVEVPGEPVLAPGERWRLHLMRGGGRLWIHSMAAGATRLAGRETTRFRTYEDTEQARRRGITGRVYWEETPIRWSIFDGTTPDLEPSVVEAVVQDAFAAWTAPACTTLTMIYDGLTTDAIAEFDGNNTVQWFESGWTDLGYSRAQVGVTEVERQMFPSGWRFIGADIALNGEHYTWVTSGGEPGSGRVDLQAILTHEFGHLVGMKHTCEDAGADGAPACTEGDEATMPTMRPEYFGEQERTLERDDIAGLCYLYPAEACTEQSCPRGWQCVSGTCLPDASVDAGVPDASSSTDAGSEPDAGRPSPSRDGCAVDSSTRADGLAWLFALGLFALERRRR